MDRIDFLTLVAEIQGRVWAETAAGFLLDV